MEVVLKAESINKAQVAKTAMIDAVIWYWFHQVAYVSRFTESLGGVPALDSFSIGFSIVFGIAILFTRWDAIPAAFRISMPVLALLSISGLFFINYSSLTGTVLEVVILVFFQISCSGCQILRLENLAKCSSVRNLTVSLVSSLVLFYVLGVLLLSLPSMIYDVYLVLAPLILLIGLKAPVPSVDRRGKLSRKTFFLTPNILLVAFGLAGGFVFATGGVESATDISTLFDAPSPSFLIMLLFYMELGIMLAYGLKFRRGMFFAFMNLVWTLGSLVGTLVLSVAPTIPDSLPLVISAAVFICFSFIQSTWLDGPKYRIDVKEVAAEKLARAKGLSNRETEVVLLLLEGRSLRHIQNELFISEGTARTHTKRIYSKLGVHSKQELIDFFKINEE